MNKDYIYSSDGEIPVLVIFAPTATGKTATVGHLFSDNVPSFFSGKAEIINADSMQVYKGLDIGTAKAWLRGHRLRVGDHRRKVQKDY